MRRGGSVSDPTPPRARHNLRLVRRHPGDRPRRRQQARSAPARLLPSRHARPHPIAAQQSVAQQPNKRARSGVSPAPGSTKTDGGEAARSLRPSRGVRTVTVGSTRLAADAPASRGVTRHSQDANRIGLDRSWVPARPSGVSTPLGLASDAALRATEAARRPCLCFRPPSEASVAVPHGPAGPWASSSDHAPSPGLLRPYDTISGLWRVTAAAPAATRDRVRGLATPCTVLTTFPPGARNAGASLGFFLQGFFPVRGTSSSRSRCPLDVAGPRATP